MENWNISLDNGKELIINSINYLFYINNSYKLPIQYICMNLKFYIRQYEIMLFNKNKRRNLNNYIKNIYGGFYKFINLECQKYFKIRYSNHN